MAAVTRDTCVDSACLLLTGLPRYIFYYRIILRIMIVRIGLLDVLKDGIVDHLENVADEVLEGSCGLFQLD